MNWFEKYLLGTLVKRVYKRRKGMLKGYVSAIGFGLMIVTGILQILGVAPEAIQTNVQGWDLIMAGIAGLGIARKLAVIEKK